MKKTLVHFLNGFVIGVAYASMIIMLVFACSSCSSKVVQVPVYVHDTVKTVQTQRDSTFVDRWHTVYQKGDTVFVTNEQITVKLRTITDTAYKYVEKPVEVVKEQIREVEKPLRWWQTALMWLGAIVAGVGIVLLAWKVIVRKNR